MANIPNDEHQNNDQSCIYLSINCKEERSNVNLKYVIKKQEGQSWVLRRVESS